MLIDVLVEARQSGSCANIMNNKLFIDSKEYNPTQRLHMNNVSDSFSQSKSTPNPHSKYNDGKIIPKESSDQSSRNNYCRS